MSLYTKGHKFSKHIKIYYPPTVKCHFYQEIEKSPSEVCSKHWKHNNDDTVALFSVNRAFFYTVVVKELISQFSFCQRTYLNNQPCDQAVLGIIEHSSNNRQQIQVKDMTQSHTDMESYKRNVSQLY